MTNEDGSANEREIYASRTTFMNLFDIQNDLFLLSTSNFSPEIINTYQLVHAQSKNPKNAEFLKINQVKKELTDILQDMRTGKVFLDPSMPFKFEDKTETLKDPHSFNDHVSESDNTGQIPLSSFKQLKAVFEDLMNDTWFYNTNHKKESMLRLSH